MSTDIAKTLGIEPWRLLFRARRAGWILDEDACHESVFRAPQANTRNRWRTWVAPTEAGPDVEVYTHTTKAVQP